MLHVIIHQINHFYLTHNVFLNVVMVIMEIYLVDYVKNVNHHVLIVSLILNVWHVLIKLIFWIDTLVLKHVQLDISDN